MYFRCFPFTIPICRISYFLAYFYMRKLSFCLEKSNTSPFIYSFMLPSGNTTLTGQLIFFDRAQQHSISQFNSSLHYTLRFRTYPFTFLRVHQIFLYNINMSDFLLFGALLYENFLQITIQLSSCYVDFPHRLMKSRYSLCLRSCQGTRKSPGFINA